MTERQRFEQNLGVCRAYAEQMVTWLRSIGLDEVQVDGFEAQVDAILAAASLKTPPPAEIIDIKDYLPPTST